MDITRRLQHELAQLSTLDPFGEDALRMASPGRDPQSRQAARLATALRRYGFLARLHFVERLVQRGLAQGVRFDPQTFAREFARARHYRQTRPGYTTRIAIVRGLPILYRPGGWRGHHIVLIGVLPSGALPPVAPVRPPQLSGQALRETDGIPLRQALEQEEADHFYIKVKYLPFSKEGHEILTREAAAGLPGISASETAALIEGVRRPDLAALHDLRKALDSNEQRRHSLRRYDCQPPAEALREIRSHLASLHRRALAAGRTPDGLKLAGEALHLIQDSYSDAHMERLGLGLPGPHPITYIRSYGRPLRSPREHGVPTDKRDSVHGARWRNEAVTASRDYLKMLGRHLKGLGSPADDLKRFMNRHLSLSRSPSHPCPPGGAA